jgi:hypothetical protein
MAPQSHENFEAVRFCAHAEKLPLASKLSKA